KLNPDGSSIVYSTFLGGSSLDIGYSIIIDNENNAYIAGYTSSSNFPITNSAYQKYNIGNLDLFITKLNSTGNHLIYSTYIGGSSADYCFAVTIDSVKNAYITGYTSSSDFPTTIGAYQTDYLNWDAFVTKLNPDGSSIVYSTFLGGISTDISNSISLDTSNNVYITGYTFSSDFPTTIGAYQTSFSGGDVFIAKVNFSGSSLIYSTLIGGGSGDGGSSIVVDSDNNAFLTGYTASNNFPTTSNAYQTSKNGFTEAFVTKLNIPTIYFKFLSPLYGEILQSNTIYNIIWEENYIPQKMKIEFSFDNGNNWILLAEISPGIKNYNWEVVPLDISSAKIKIYPVGFEYLAQISEPFQITTSTTDRVSLTSQNTSNFKYKIGTSQNITWEKFGNVSNINLEYTIDGGSTWKTIANNLNADLLSYSWVIPDEPTEDCKIKITDSANPLVYDYCDAFFTIKKIILTSFNAFERIKGNTQKQITWASYGFDYFYIYYSIDNGVNWNYLVYTNSNTGFYDWTLPQISSEQCLIKLVDGGDFEEFDISDNNFEIWIPIVIAKTPTSGNNSICFDNTLVCLDFFTFNTPIITSTYYPYEAPTIGVTPTGSNIDGDYYWTVSAQNISFLNGKISIPLEFIPGETNPSKLHWFKRINSGDAWTDIGGSIINNSLQSSSTFTSFGEFTLGSYAVKTKLKVFLQGNYSAGSMTTLLNSSSIIPTEQPYSSQPFLYNG
ncbi:MAG: SBBP repeat-containing protein, partial [Melioribacteraceae bacterium]